MAKQRGHRANKANDNRGTIADDSLYRGKYRDEVYSESEDSEEGTPQQEATPSLTDTSDDGSDYKKRYDDLKRHYDSKLAAWRKEKDELLQAQQAGAVQGINPSELPRTQEQLEAFKRKYPEVYAVMETVSSQRAEEKLSALQEEVKSLKSREQELETKSAYKELLNRHPDFETLKTSESFLKWLDDQPPSISDGIYHNNSDVSWASRVVDLYKADMGIKSSAKRSSQADPAATISVNSAKDVVGAASGDKKVWKASEIRKMKPWQFEKVEAELDAARAEGRIDFSS